MIPVDTNLSRDPSPEHRGKNHRTQKLYSKPTKPPSAPVAIVAMTRCRWCQWCAVAGLRCTQCGVEQ